MQRPVLLSLCLTIALPLAAAVTGIVVGPDGAPLAGAKVAAYRPLPPMQVARVLRREPLASATTNKDGTFSLDVQGYGLVGVQVIMNGYAPTSELVSLNEDAGTVALQPASEIEGTVIASGKPAVGASVMVMAADGVPLLTTTNAAGKYRVPDPAVWAQSILVQHPDYAVEWHQPNAADFVLDSGREINGKVVDANGRPVPQANVDLAGLMSTTSDADGKFTFKHAPQQQGALLKAHGSAGIAAALFTAGSPVLKLQPASHLTVVVRDQERHPLAGISVTSGGDEDAPEAAGDSVTDATGIAMLDVPRGQYEIEIYAPGQYTAEPVKVDATAANAKVECTARRQQPIQGVVRSEDHRPVSGAEISFLYESRGTSWLTPTGKVTAPDGSFRIYMPPDDSGSKTRFVAVKPGLAPALSEPVSIDRRTQRVTITIPAGVPIGGSVAGEDGKAIEGVSVDPVIGSQAGPEEPSMPVPHQPWARTDREGRFSGMLTPATHGLSISKKGYTAVQRALVVENGAKPLAVVLVRGSSISGRVLNSDGSPAPEVNVSTEAGFAVSGADGSFVIDPVPPGPQVLHFGRAPMQRQAVIAPASGVTLVLPAMRSVRGHVIDVVTSAPVEEFSIGLVSTNDEFSPRQQFQSASGEFTIDLPVSAAKISVSAAGYLSLKDVEIKSPAEEPLIVRLGRGRALRGRVTDEKQQPVAGVAVSARSVTVDFENGGTAQSGPDGSYEIAGIGFDADVRVIFEKDEYAKAERKLKAGRDDATLDAVLTRGFAVSGRVVDRSGAGAGNIVVTATSATYGAGTASAATDESGSFRLAGLAPGRYDFSASNEQTGERGTMKDVDIEKTKELAIRLAPVATGTIYGHVTGIPESATRSRFVSIQTVEGEPAGAPIDIAGNFRTDAAPAGTVEVVAEVSDGRSSRQSNKVTVDLAAGSEARVDLSFGAQLVIHGHVFRGDAALPNTSIHFSGSGSFTALTEASGVYEISIDAGEYDVSIDAGDGKSLPFVQHISVSESREFDFHVNVAIVAVTILDAESGQPIAGAAVQASRRGETHSVGTAQTGVDGSATLDVPDGEQLTVIASRIGYANASEDVTGSSQAVVMRLARTPGAVVRVIDVRDGSTLSGYVIARDSSGRVVASATETDPDGTVTLPVAPGSYAFSASAEGFGSHTVRGDVPSGEIRIPLPRGGNLLIRSNHDIRGSARLIQPDGEEYVRCWCNGIAEIKVEGRATLVDRISPGPYVLEVTVAGEKPKRYPVTVVEGQTTTAPLD